MAYSKKNTDNTDYVEFFDVRVRVGGARGRELRDIVKAKMDKESRRNLRDTVEAIILESSPKPKK